jgi:hypothetical protein
LRGIGGGNGVVECGLVVVYLVCWGCRLVLFLVLFLGFVVDFCLCLRGGFGRVIFRGLVFGFGGRFVCGCTTGGFLFLLKGCYLRYVSRLL